MAGKDNLKPFPKGKSGNPNGRPRKAFGILKPLGYTKEEAVATLQNLLGLTEQELKAIKADKEATILETTIASAVLKSKEKGSLYSIDSLMDRVFGKAVELKDVKVAGEIKAAVTVTVIKSDVPLAHSEKEIQP